MAEDMGQGDRVKTLLNLKKAKGKRVLLKFASKNPMIRDLFLLALQMLKDMKMFVP